MPKIKQDHVGVDSYLTVHRLPGHRTFRVQVHGRDIKLTCGFYKATLAKGAEITAYAVDGFNGKIKKMSMTPDPDAKPALRPAGIAIMNPD